MTRVLQLRRGSTENNDAFTGMPGEITMDMDAKTLRIHDGETLGGFEIARRDDIKKVILTLKIYLMKYGQKLSHGVRQHQSK